MADEDIHEPVGDVDRGGESAILRIFACRPGQTTVREKYGLRVSEVCERTFI